MKQHMKHTTKLDYLARHLDLVDEPRHDLCWMMKEGVWIRPTGNQGKLCDIIAVYYSSRIGLIELKYDEHKRGEAIVQLEWSEKFVRDNLESFCVLVKKIVYYDVKGEFRYEVA